MTLARHEVMITDTAVLRLTRREEETILLQLMSTTDRPWQYGKTARDGEIWQVTGSEVGGSDR